MSVMSFAASIMPMIKASCASKPEICNTNRGSQFSSIDFTAVLKEAEIAISIDGRGAWRDNVFVERLWRSIKYEEVYLHAYKTVSEARVGIGRYPTFLQHPPPTFIP
ncbi:Integrase core domain [Rhizobium mongolense subsp. loessense]|uniref:Integrase core domain n=1 Tax=Rhizobium mongolense subsp. loessense TaxID=158890 RepID=A0A1G4U5F3_9HYPH|nr:Integrase core domain [Rhizobium mongolense subsp. loessense]